MQAVRKFRTTPAAAAAAARGRFGPRLAHGRLLRRLGVGLAGGVVLLALAVGVAEWVGWPFLAGPMQSMLTKALDRPVYLEGTPRAAASATSSDDRSDRVVPPTVAASAGSATRVAAGVKVRLFGRVEVHAQRIEIAAPAWSRRPPLLVGENARLRLRYGDLWRAYRGEALRVRRLEADRLQVDLERLADGRASWQFGPPKGPSAKPPMVPVFEDLRVGDGRLGLRDALLDSVVDARFVLVDRASSATVGTASAPGSTASPDDRPAAGLRAEATGRYRALPLKLSVRTVGVLPWVADDAAQQAVPLTVDGSVGRARLRFDGAVRDVQHLAGLDGRFTLAGPSLAAVGDVVGVTLPTTAPFTTRGRLAKDGDVWHTRIDEAGVGRSRLTADLRYDPTPATPLLSGRVGGPRLLLADLGPAIGTGTPSAGVPTPVAAPGRVLPVREFDLPSLRAMDADVQLAFDELDLGTDRLQPLKPLRAHLVLKDAVLELRDLDARTADGQLRGLLSLDGRSEIALWRSDLRWSEVRIEQWLRQARPNGAPPYLTGRFDGRAKLGGRGRSTAQILASLDGELFGRLRDGTLSHLVVEGAGIDIAQAIGVFVRGDDPLPMDCAVADLRVTDGVARPRAMVVDARDSVIWVDGQVSLVDETMDLRAIVAPRDFSPLALRTPVKVQGTLSDPRVSLAAGPLVGRLAAAALLATLNPLAAILPLVDPGSEAAPGNVPGGCRQLARQAAQRRSPG